MLSNKKKITVRISSGLGNQLFMFCNAFYLSEKYDLKLKIDDIITEVNREKVIDSKSFLLQINKIQQTGRSSLLFKVIRKDETIWVTSKFIIIE